MNNIELLVKHTGDVNFTRLDLFGNETISLTQVVQDVKDPGKIFTNFTTQSFFFTVFHLYIYRNIIFILFMV